MSQPLANIPADYEKRLIKMDFDWAANNRERDPRRMDQALQRQVAAEVSDGDGRAMRALAAVATLRCGLRRDASRKPLRLLHRRSRDVCARRSRAASSSASSARPAAARRRCCASSPAWRRRAAGTIVQGGRDISRLPPVERDYGIVFQSYALFPEPDDRRQRRLRARQPASGPRRRSTARVDELLKLVGLPGSRREVSRRQLSGGQQQRIALARALATSPGLLLLDEPLSALDALERVRLRGEIRALQQRLGVTTIMVTHDQEEALSMADRIVVMNHGVHRAGRHAAGDLPRAGDAVRRRFRRQGQRARRPPRAGRRRCASARAASTLRGTTAEPARRRQAVPASRGRAGAADRGRRQQRRSTARSRRSSSSARTAS